MRRYANDPGESLSLLEPLRELQDRLSLQIPEDYIKAEELRESNDRDTAGFTLLWFDHSQGKLNSRMINVDHLVDKLVDDVFDKYPIAWDISTSNHGDVNETQIKIRWQTKSETRSEEKNQQKKKKADYSLNDAVDSYQLSLEVGDSTIEAVSEYGTTWDVRIDDEVLNEDLPSPGAALAAIVEAAVDESILIALDDGNSEAAQDYFADFLVQIGPWLADNAAVPPAARDHLIAYLELTTHHEFDA